MHHVGIFSMVEFGNFKWKVQREAEVCSLVQIFLWEDKSSPFGIHFNATVIKGGLILHFVTHHEYGSKIKGVVSTLISKWCTQRYKT